MAEHCYKDRPWPCRCPLCSRTPVPPGRTGVRGGGSAVTGPTRCAGGERDGTGLDHPRYAGMALHLGYLLDLPTVGVPHRSLCAEDSWPDDEKGSISPLTHGGRIVGYWVRTRDGARPLVAHAAWRTSPETAAQVVLSTTWRARTPEPLRLARQLARTARAGKEPLKR